MLHSMTAFSRHGVESPQATLTWEIYTLNHRYLDITCKLPEILRDLEPQLRERVNRYLHRGKVDCQLKYQPTEQTRRTLALNPDLLQQFIRVSQEVQNALGQNITLSITDLLNWPGILQNTAPDMKQLQQYALNAFDETLQDLLNMRRREGQALQAYLTTHLDQLLEQVNVIKQRLPTVLTWQREKILARIAELQISVENSRLEQELLFLTQKMDTAEEIGRLQMHVAELQQTFTTTGPIGRRMDFLMQELHREANTLGAKSLDATMTHAVVNLKVLIEQMREQIQNIE